ncbi:hypothetical protein G4B88_030034, partial [Cannabis sativa]
MVVETKGCSSAEIGVFCAEKNKKEKVLALHHCICISIMRQPDCSRKSQHVIVPKSTAVVIETAPAATSNMPEPGVQTSNGRPQQAMETFAAPFYQTRLVEETATLIERIYNLGASKFSGSTSPDDAEEWIQRLEEIFDIIDCSDEQKLSVTRMIVTAVGWTEFRGLVNSAERVELCISDHQSNQEQQQQQQQQRIDKIIG